MPRIGTPSAFLSRGTVPESKTVPYTYPEAPDIAAMPKVFATGFMIVLMEWTCIQMLAPHLDAGEGSIEARGVDGGDELYYRGGSICLVRGEQEHSIAVVLPLREGMREVAAEFLEEGPPFDPEHLGLVRHQVFLGDSEVIFVFETVASLALVGDVPGFQGGRQKLEVRITARCRSQRGGERAARRSAFPQASSSRARSSQTPTRSPAFRSKARL